MRILDEEYSERFERFLDEHRKKIWKTVIFRPMPPEIKGVGAFQDQPDCVLIFLKAGLPPQAREANCGHEILHAVQMAEGFPRTLNPLGERKAGEYGRELGSLVLDLDIRQRMQPWNFDTRYSDNHRYEKSSKGLKETARKRANISPGSYWFCIYSLRYAYLKLTQTPKRFDKLRNLFERYFSQTAETGERIVSIVAQCGYSTPDQALNSMLAINDLLDQFSRCWIEDLRTGRIYEAPPASHS